MSFQNKHEIDLSCSRLDDLSGWGLRSNRRASNLVRNQEVAPHI